MRRRDFLLTTFGLLPMATRYIYARRRVSTWAEAHKECATCRNCRNFCHCGQFEAWYSHSPLVCNSIEELVDRTRVPRMSRAVEPIRGGRSRHAVFVDDFNMLHVPGDDGDDFDD